MCTMGAKIIDDLGARKMGCCLKAVFDGRNTYEGDRFLDKIKMCDENRLWQYNPKTKQQSSQWTGDIPSLEDIFLHFAR